MESRAPRASFRPRRPGTSFVRSGNPVPVPPDLPPVFRVSSGAATPLAEVPRAAVTSLAITSWQVIAVLRRVDGTTDAIAIPR